MHFNLLDAVYNVLKARPGQKLTARSIAVLVMNDHIDETGKSLPLQTEQGASELGRKIAFHQSQLCQIYPEIRCEKGNRQYHLWFDANCPDHCEQYRTWNAADRMFVRNWNLISNWLPIHNLGTYTPSWKWPDAFGLSRNMHHFLPETRTLAAQVDIPRLHTCAQTVISASSIENIESEFFRGYASTALAEERILIFSNPGTQQTIDILTDLSEIWGITLVEVDVELDEWAVHTSAGHGQQANWTRINRMFQQFPEVRRFVTDFVQAENEKTPDILEWELPNPGIIKSTPSSRATTKNAAR